MIAATPDGTPSFSPCVTSPTPPTKRKNAPIAARWRPAIGSRALSCVQDCQAMRITPAQKMCDAAKRNAGMLSTPIFTARKFNP